MLMEDFKDRCAYSLVHRKCVGDSELHVDHFDPAWKRICSYENLFPAYGLVNEAKHETWPSKADEAAGAHFLNPCEVKDYDGQIFEDPDTHELVGTTVAARYHIDMLDLNNDALVAHRHERSVWLKILDTPVIQKSLSTESEAAGVELVAQILEIVRYKIPAIKPPPPEASEPA